MIIFNVALILLSVVLMGLMYDIIGFILNAGPLKDNKLPNLLAGFISLIIMTFFINIPLVLFHPNIVTTSIINVVIIIGIIFLCMWKFGVDIKSYDILFRIRHTDRVELILIIILSLILVFLSVSNVDTWLYGSLVENSIYGIQSTNGFVMTTFDRDVPHLFNTYYVLQSILVYIFHTNYILYSFGPFRVIEAIIIVQVISQISKHLTNKYAIIYLFIGLIGIDYLSPIVSLNMDYVLLMSGNNGTFYLILFSMLFPILYLKKQDEKYIIIYILTAIALSSSALLLIPILIVILSFSTNRKFLYSFITYVIVLFPYIYIMGNIRLNILYFTIAIILFLLYRNTSVKLSLILFITSLFLVSSRLSDFYSYLSFVYIDYEGLVLVVIIIAVISMEDNNYIKRYALISVLIAFLIYPTMQSYSYQVKVIEHRYWIFLPFNILIIESLEKTKFNKTILVLLLIISIPSNIYFGNTSSRLISISEIINDQKSYIQRIIGNDDISVLLDEFESYNEVDINFVNEDYNRSLSSVTDITFISSFRPGVEIYFPNSPNFKNLNKNFCQDGNEDLCITVEIAPSYQGYDNINILEVNTDSTGEFSNYFEEGMYVN